jgi:hypothetical protein
MSEDVASVSRMLERYRDLIHRFVITRRLCGIGDVTPVTQVTGSRRYVAAPK